MSEWNMAERRWMQQALRLAARGQGWVEPNPMVGAVVVRNGVLVGEGFHARFGGAHAEVVALEQAGTRARGATVFVTLEPCCHHGKTPPCTDALVRARVGRVVAAVQDPFPEVSGKGLGQLERVGIATGVGLCRAEAEALLAPYLKRLRTGRPWVIAKWAMSADGKIATATGESKWITGELARGDALRLRGRLDAVLVGIGTALADDPELTARDAKCRDPVRVVVDSRARLRVDSRLAQSARRVPVLVATTDVAPPASIEALRGLGCECLSLPADRGHVPLGDLLDELGRRGMTNVLVEGGAGLLGAFFERRLVDEARVYVAPRVIGGATARGPIGGAGLQRLGDALQVAHWQIRRLGPDVVLTGRLTHPDSSAPTPG